LDFYPSLETLNHDDANMIIRKATPNDYDAVWKILSAVIKTGDTYVFIPESGKEDMNQHWFAQYSVTFVAEEHGEILGTYILRPNQTGLGAHIANCSYMVHSDNQRKGVGTSLCAHSIRLARNSGYKAIQFNLVVSTNEVAIKLWNKFGFKITGTIPKGFRHLKKGFVDAYVMYEEL
jgi:L-amino acid N-acyltransferase YncA